jgi:ubiquinone/menaquinone biosynthesis C-methylase UbiE
VSADVIDYDAELQLHNEQLRAALGIRTADRLLDIGCGTGQTTREAARVASVGDALGIDIDGGMIARARELADREGVPNVRFEVGDAQAHPFRSGAHRRVHRALERRRDSLHLDETRHFDHPLTEANA